VSGLVRVGVIGRGFGERVVAPAFASIDGCEVVDVVSARDERAVRELCARRDLDLVSVHSPPFLHARDVRLALDGGHAVLCDKPFGTGAVVSRALYDEARERGVVHLVNFEFRYDPVRRALREAIADGAVGRVEHVQWTHLSAGSRVPLRRYGWLFRRDHGGGWIGAWASHAVDTLRFLFGGEVDVVASAPRTTIRQRPDAHGVLHDCDAEDGLAALLSVADGISVTIDSGFAAPVTMTPRIVVTGSDGVLEDVADRRLVLRTRDGPTDLHVDDDSTGDRHAGPMARWAAVVRDAVRDGIAPDDAPTFADGVACAAVLDRLRMG
jgi:predicted dehydrogenase